MVTLHFWFKYNPLKVGAKTVKWTAPDPYLVFKGSDSQLYTNFGSMKKKKFIDTLKIYWSTKPKKIMMTKNKSKRSLHILEDGASVVQVGDICLKYNNIITIFVNLRLSLVSN